MARLFALDSNAHEVRFFRNAHAARVCPLNAPDVVFCRQAVNQVKIDMRPTLFTGYCTYRRYLHSFYIAKDPSRKIRPKGALLGLKAVVEIVRTLSIVLGYRFGKGRSVKPKHMRDEAPL